MKHESRFQIRGVVTDCRDETYQESRKCALVLKVQVSQDKAFLFEVSVWDEWLCRVAARCKGKNVLVLGRLTGGKNERGYFNVWMRAEALMVEPGSERAAGGVAPAAPAAAQHAQAKANGYQPQADEPLPWEENMANDDIPF